MLRYKLRTLLILMAVCPPLLWLGWGKYQAWRAEQLRREAARQMAQQRAKERMAALRVAIAAAQVQRAAQRAEIMAELEARRAAAGPLILVDPPPRAPNEL
jgi:hypothetical protein